MLVNKSTSIVFVNHKSCSLAVSYFNYLPLKTNKPALLLQGEHLSVITKKTFVLIKGIILQSKLK